MQRAELLAFPCPMWWFSRPSVLKGWVERAFAVAVAYGGTVGRGLQGRRTMLFTTGNTEEMFGPGARDGDLDIILFPIQHGMLYFVGCNVLAPS